MRYSQTLWVKITTSPFIQKARTVICEAEKAQLPMIKNNRSPASLSPQASSHRRRADRLHAGRRLPLLHGNELDVLVAGNCVLRKNRIPS
jgi:hypothetical protein